LRIPRTKSGARPFLIICILQPTVMLILHQSLTPSPTCLVSHSNPCYCCCCCCCCFCADLPWALLPGGFYCAWNVEGSTVPLRPRASIQPPAHDTPPCRTQGYSAECGAACAPALMGFHPPHGRLQQRIQQPRGVHGLAKSGGRLRGRPHHLPAL